MLALPLHELHHLGSGLGGALHLGQVAAVGEDGVVEGLELKAGGSRWLPMLLSVQFHPERLMDRYQEHEAIFRVFTRACLLNR